MERWLWQKRLLVAVVAAALVAGAPATATALSEYQYVRSDGSVQSSPALTATPTGERFLAVRGTDENVYTTRFDFNAGWTVWEPLGAPPGGAKGDPALVSTAPGVVYLFVRGADSKLWEINRASTGQWGLWFKPVGDDGTLKGSPRVSARGGGGTIDVFVLGTDDRVYQRFGIPPLLNDRWLSLDEPPGDVGLVGDPAAASHDGAEVALFARGTDNKLWGRTWNGSAWSPWAQTVPDGVLNSSPAATSSGLGGVVVFVRGTDNQLYSNERLPGGTWGGWKRESLTANNPFQDSPSAATLPNAHIEVAVRGINNLAYTEVYRF